MKTYTLLNKHKEFIMMLPNTIKSMDAAKQYVSRYFGDDYFINESKWHVVSNNTVKYEGNQPRYDILRLENYLCHPSSSETYSVIWEILNDDGTVSHYVNAKYDNVNHGYIRADVDDLMIDGEDFLRSCLKRFYDNGSKLPYDKSYEDCDIKPLKLWAKQVINRDRNERL